MAARACVYCSIREGTTADHVPPKVLFPKPRPSDLVTVPCCESCRRGQSLDDEYFARMIAMRADVADHPAATVVLEGVHRSLVKPQKQRFTSALLRSVREIEVRSPTGLYLGQAASYDVDLGRCCRVVERTLRGLYFALFRRRLSDEAQCMVYALDGFPVGDLSLEAKLRRLLDVALAGTTRVFGEKVFTYSVARVDGPEVLTVWAFLVYSRVLFIGTTREPTLISGGRGAA